MSTPASTTPAPVKITVEPPRAPRKARAPRAAKPKQQQATTTPPPAPAAKPKPEPVGTPILPAKRKAVPADLKAPHVYVVACTAAPERLATLKNAESPAEYVESHTPRIIESAVPIKGWAPGKTFSIYHARNRLDLGEYQLIAKKDIPAGKLIVWTAVQL
jgi:hypothetical protein